MSAMYGVCKDCGSFVATKTHFGKVPILSVCGAVLAIVGPLAVQGACGTDRDFRIYGTIFVSWPSVMLGVVMFIWGFRGKKQ